MFLYLSTLIAVKERICFGPLCDMIKQTADPSIGGDTNGVFLQKFGDVMSKSIVLFFVLASLVMLFFILMGAFDWITSEGDKEKVAKAQKKIQNAIVGMILAVAGLTFFGVVSGSILGIIKFENGGWNFTLPQLNEYKAPLPPNAPCSPGDPPPC